MESDLQLALSLREEEVMSHQKDSVRDHIPNYVSDLELAKRLQAEEEERLKKKKR